eukprot:GAFH01004065.1.p2 GENE.GAFH01004065.1~~GAFH01004065.1.p2  ORF type:complete len:76 (+),score=17.64 GAFH01004065.1:499-726(+)
MLCNGVSLQIHGFEMRLLLDEEERGDLIVLKMELLELGKHAQPFKIGQLIVLKVEDLEISKILFGETRQGGDVLP